MGVPLGSDGKLCLEGLLGELLCALREGFGGVRIQGGIEGCRIQSGDSFRHLKKSQHLVDPIECNRTTASSHGSSENLHINNSIALVVLFAEGLEQCGMEHLHVARFPDISTAKPPAILSTWLHARKMEWAEIAELLEFEEGMFCTCDVFVVHGSGLYLAILAASRLLSTQSVSLHGHPCLASVSRFQHLVHRC